MGEQIDRREKNEVVRSLKERWREYLVKEQLNTTTQRELIVDLFLRSHDQYRELPVLILTTRGDNGSRAAALKAGASADLSKPFSPSTLGSAVRALQLPSTPLRGAQP